MLIKKGVSFRGRLLLILSVVLSLIISPISVSAQDNGAALKPIMGWSSWSSIRDTPTEAKIKAQADQVASKLLTHGYQYINLDDFYYLDPNTTVDKYGRWVVDTSIFPSGMKALGDYIHSKGLKFGMYITAGIPKAAVDQNTPIEGTSYHARDIADTSRNEINYNFHFNSNTVMYYIDFSKPGSQEFINSWANLFASYGIDFLKIDGVGSWNIPDVIAWSKALNQTGRKICFELSNNLDINSIGTWQQYANGWRTSDDVESYSSTTTDWNHILRRFADAEWWAHHCGPGGYNDFDSINVANGSRDGLTNDEKQTCVTLWAMGSSQFYTGNDMTNTDSYGLSLLTNDNVIAVNQVGYGAIPEPQNGSAQVWHKAMPDGSYAIALFNKGDSATTVTTDFSKSGYYGGLATVKDLWSNSVLGTYNGSYSTSINPHGCKLIQVTPTLTDTSYTGTYKITNKLSGKALNVPAKSTDQGTQLIQWSYEGGTNEQWNITPNGDGTYKITNVNSGMAAVVQYASTANNAAIIQNNYSGTPNERWKIIDVGQGYVKIVNANDGLAMAVKDASKDDRANIVQWSYSGTQNDVWMLALLSTPTPTPTPTPTSTATVGFIVSGYINPDFAYSSENSDQILSGFTIEVPSLSIKSETNNKGYFEINLPSGSYEINIKKPSYLKRTFTINVSGDTMIYDQGNVLNMWAGDLQFDGKQDLAINMYDILGIAQAFNSISGDEKYKTTSDLNMDGAINMSDIFIVAQHFNKITEDYPLPSIKVISRM